MSQSNTHLERSMSYRKPVPVYVPSPPPSPTVLGKALGLEETDDLQLHVPPLPENWREVITTKTQDGNSSRVSVHTFQKALTTSESGPSNWLHCMEREGEDHKLLAVPSAALKSSQRKHTTRGLPTQYRPPTPPLPSSRSLRVSPESQVASGNVMVPMSPYLSPGPSLENVQRPADARSLRLSPSFQTDRTVVSHGSGHISTPWSRSFGTLAYGEPSHRSTYPKKEVDLSETLDARNNSSSSLLCCGSFGTMTKNLKAFWSYKRR